MMTDVTLTVKLIDRQHTHLKLTVPISDLQNRLSSVRTVSKRRMNFTMTMQHLKSME
jgi:hypothetical protein